MKEEVESKVAKQNKNLSKLQLELKRMTQENQDLRRASNTAVDYTPKKAQEESALKRSQTTKLVSEKPPKSNLMQRLISAKTQSPLTVSPSSLVTPKKTVSMSMTKKPTMS